MIMNTILVFCLWLFVTITLAAEYPTFCVKKGSKCEDAKKSGLNVTCYEIASSGSCISEVVNGKADLALASADDIVKHVDRVELVLGENYGLDDSTARYFGMAVVKKTSTFDIFELEGKKTCHTGVDETVGWKIAVGYLLRNKLMPFVDNQYKSAAEFFGGSCVPGIRDVIEDKQVTDKLCQLCDKNCSRDDRYSGFEGALLCLAEGRGDVAFVPQTTLTDTVKDVSDYKFLCPNGNKKYVLDKRGRRCDLDSGPSGAIVTGYDKNASVIEMYRKIIQGVPFKVLVDNKIVGGEVKSLTDPEETTRGFLGKYYYDVKALTPAHKTDKTDRTDKTNKTFCRCEPTGSSGSSSAAASLIFQVFGLVLFFVFQS